MPTLHERVAAKMKASYVAGTLNSYETILAALLRDYPTEESLRVLIAEMESWARQCGAPEDWHYLDDHH
jgi:hypothetical protein